MNYLCKQCGKKFEAKPATRTAEHRLLVGDCLDVDDISRAMGFERADAAITDPPYAVSYERSHESRGGDVRVHATYQEADGPGILRFLRLVAADVVVMSFPVDRHFFALADAIREAGFEVRKELVWVKDSFSFWPGAQYQQRHEPILVLARKGRPLGSVVPANESTVLEFPRPAAHDLHPTAKPVELWRKLIRFHSRTIFADYFCGSGTSFVAAEQEHRLCCGLEISPQYCAVILERLADIGLEPRLAWASTKASGLVCRPFGPVTQRQAALLHIEAKFTSAVPTESGTSSKA
jgi:DNA modification methylase